MKWIFVDLAKFKQILYNLLSNAVKFTSESGSIIISGSLSEMRIISVLKILAKVLHLILFLLSSSLSYKLINSKQKWKKDRTWSCSCQAFCYASWGESGLNLSLVSVASFHSACR